MEIIRSSKDLMERIEKLTREDSVCQVLIPGKGQVTIVLQETLSTSIADDVQQDRELGKMIENSRTAYAQGDTMTTAELLQSRKTEYFRL